jgi:hypothetical protein
VFEYGYKVISESEQGATVDTARGVFVPTGGERRVWEGSWISQDTHIQLCVRNPASLLGAWLHYPIGLEATDVCEALQAGIAEIEPEDPQARKKLKAMSKKKRIDLMVEAGVITPARK